MTVRSVELTHDRLMVAWYCLHDMMYVPTMSAADTGILREALLIVGEKAREVALAEQMQKEEVFAVTQDILEEMTRHGRQTE